MVKVEISLPLYEEIEKKFKKEANKIFVLFESLKESPKKGKVRGIVGGIIIKKLKFEGWRFYFITDGFKLKCLRKEDLESLLFLFVRNSNKKNQQKIIEEIRSLLLTLGPEGI